MGDRRKLSAIGKGSYATGWVYRLKNPRIVVGFPQYMMDLLKQEAIEQGVPVGEIVRRRVKESYR